MNSDKPQKPKSEFPEAFDSDEIEIDVAYEEITPEEQLEIKKRVAQTAASSNIISEPLSDMWLDDDFEVIDIEEQADIDNIKSESNSLEQEKVLQDTNLELTESEPGADKLPVESHQTETEKTVVKSEPESDRLSVEADELEEETKAESEPVLDNREIESRNSETEETEAEFPPESDNWSIEYSNSDSDEILEELDGDLDDSEPVLDNRNKIENEPIELGKETATEKKLPLLDNLEPEALNNSVAEFKEPDVSVGSENADRELIDDRSNESTTESTTTELIADSWLDESEKIAAASKQQTQRHQELTSQIAQLEQQKTSLQTEITNLKAQKEEIIARQTQEITENLVKMVEEGTRELKERKNNLLVDIEKLERRRERIRQEMRTNFAGASQDLAVRIQGFKEYLVGSLQDLATAAERLDLPKPEDRRRPSQRDSRTTRETRETREARRPRNSTPEVSSQPQFTEQTFAEQNRRIRQLLETYRTRPDYYGAPWQLRRTFEPIHAERVQEWFFEQGGRGAIKGMGSRLQNVLVASAIVSVLHRLYSDRVRVLVLVDTPEKLGEWRRGLQDCLGVSRNDFGANRGIVLFESADVLVQRAERLLKDKLLPIIIIDETEELVNLTLLKFPLWLAFAERSQPKSSGYLY